MRFNFVCDVADLNGADPLCLNDFGAERDTGYMRQIVFALIDNQLGEGTGAAVIFGATRQHKVNEVLHISYVYRSKSVVK